MKKNLAWLAALALGVCALVGCTRSTADPQSQPTLPHQGETASAEDGSVYAVGETVTAKNGETLVAQPVTDKDGALVGVTLMTPEQASSIRAREEAEASYTGLTNRERITTKAERGTSPNRLTTRPTLPETEPKSVKLPETRPKNAKPSETESKSVKPPETTVPYSVPATTVAPEKIKVSYPGTLAYSENGVTVKYRIDKYEVSTVNDSSAGVTLTVHPITDLNEPVIVQIGYNCYDAAGSRLNEKTFYAPAVLNPDGTATTAYAPVSPAAVRVEFFGN